MYKYTKFSAERVTTDEVLLYNVYYDSDYLGQVLKYSNSKTGIITCQFISNIIETFPVEVQLYIEHILCKGLE